jgi:large subunit ribosomal protein L30
MAATKKAKGKSSSTVRIQYVKSAIGTPPKHKLIIKGLGFKRLNQIVTRVDSPSVRGMVAQIPHLVKIVDSGKA